MPIHPPCRRAAACLLPFAAALAQDEPATAHLRALRARVDAVLERALPTPREQAWRRIPWRSSLAAALAEARRDRKPVYAFLADGWFPTGNC